MSKSQRSKLIMTITGLMSLLLMAMVGLSQISRSPIQLTTSPQVGQFYPFENNFPIVEVAAVATALLTRLISFGYLIATVVVGAVGLITRRNALKPKLNS